MTKFLSKLFLCGILLSSVNGYCQEQGLLITAMGGVPLSTSEAFTIDRSEVNIAKNYETHYDIVIGALIDGLSYSTAEKTINGVAYASGNVITAKDFQYATATRDLNGIITWEETYGSDTVIPIRNAVGYYYQTTNQDIFTYVDGKNNDTDYSGGTPIYTWDSVNSQYLLNGTNAVTIKVIDLKTDGSGFKSDADNNILFDGNVAYKDSLGTWNLLPNDTMLTQAVLKVASGKKLTIGDKQAGETLANSNSAQLTVTQLGSIEGPATIELLNNSVTSGATPTQNQWATSVVLEPGSIVGDSADGNEVQISNGMVDLSRYITLNTNDNTPVFNTTEATKLHLTLDSTVNLFDQYIASNATASDKNNLITNFNCATIPSPLLFHGVTSVAGTGKITVGVPYVLSDGTNYYNQVSNFDASYLNSISASDTTLELHHIDKYQISGLFPSEATINYDIEAKTILKNLISTLKGQNGNLTGAETQKTITIKAAAFKNLDSSIDFDAADFTGENNTNKKFKIVVSQAHDKVSEFTVAVTGDASKKTADYDYSIDPADVIYEPDLTGATECESTFKNIENNATIVLNKLNNTCNESNGPNTTVQDSNTTIEVPDDIKRTSMDITGTSTAVINGKGKRMDVGTLSVSKNSKVKVVGTKFAIG